MSSVVLDASALIAFLFQEPGSEFVASRLPGSLISSVNYSEVIARALEKRVPEYVLVTDLGQLPLTVVAFDESLAFRTAQLKASTRALGLSLADRACLALGISRNLPVVTGDRDWSKANLPVQLVPFR